MVKEQTRSRFETLADLASQLNDASDQYTAELKAIETELARLNLGLETFIDYPLHETAVEEEKLTNQYGIPYTETCYYRYYLGYCKHNDAWRLVIRQYRIVTNDAGTDDVSRKVYNEIPLLEATRELRIAAADQILTLLDVLEDKAKQKLETLRKVTDPSKS